MFAARCDSERAEALPTAAGSGMRGEVAGMDTKHATTNAGAGCGMCEVGACGAATLT